MLADLPDKLKAPKLLALGIAVTQQSIGQGDVFPIAQGLGIQAEVHVEGANVRHVFVVPQQQPRNGASHNGELPFEAPEDLADFDQHCFYGRGSAIVVVTGEQHFAVGYFIHLMI